MDDAGDVEEFVKVLSDWREQPGKTITNVLTKVSQTKSFKGSSLNDIFKAVVDFHKEITRVEESLVDVKWYELCIKSKKILKKMI